MFLKCKSPSVPSVGVTPAWMLVLLKSYSEISVGLQLELSGKLLVHQFWLLKLYWFFSGYKKVQHSIVRVFSLEKMCQFWENWNSAQKRYIAGLRIMVSVNLLNILLWIIIRKSALSFLKQIWLCFGWEWGSGKATRWTLVSGELPVHISCLHGNYQAELDQYNEVSNHLWLGT